MTLATGHLSTAEIFAVVDAAFDAGVTKVVVTHPDYPAQNISIEDQVALAGKGALLERCFVQPYTGKCTWERWLEGTEAVGPERTLLSTDLGQVRNPAVEDGLPLMAERLLDAGFDTGQIRTMVENTRVLAGPTPGLGRLAPARSVQSQSGAEPWPRDELVPLCGRNSSLDAGRVTELRQP